MAMPDHTALAHLRALKVPVFPYFIAVQRAQCRAIRGDCRSGIG